MTSKELFVLDKGYVRLIDHMGSDLTPVNAAKASFNRRSETFGKPEERLVRFLDEHEHTSPFRHAFLSFEIKAPLFVARQWWKYAIGSNVGEWTTGWNESSRRYVTQEPEFYIPDDWREAPENKKQGSGDILQKASSKFWSGRLADHCTRGLELYRAAMDNGVCAEEARFFLSAYAMYINWWWSCSLQSLCHFLKQRLAKDAQWEIQQYARAVRALSEEVFPACLKASLDE